MRPLPRNPLGATLAALLLLTLVIGIGAALTAPIPAGAAPLANLPTETPIPPTPEPSNTPAPTATPPPTSTSAPPTATDEPPPEHHHRPSPTPTLTPSPSPTLAPSPTPGPATNLMIEKLADKQEVAPGGTVVFTLRISTTQGSTGVADVVVKDYVPEPLEVIDLASDRGDIIVQGREVTAFPANLAPGETLLIHVTARVPLDATPGTVLNTATVTTSTPGDPPGDNTSSVPVKITSVYVPRSLPVTADPNEPSLFMGFLPWVLFGGMVLVFGFTLVIQRRGWPLIRVPVRGIDPADAAVEPEAPPTLAMPAKLSQAPLVPPVAAGAGLAPQLGPELPPARAPEPLPPAPGTYSDEGESDAA
jgi:hypothetical protein